MSRDFSFADFYPGKLSLMSGGPTRAVPENTGSSRARVTGYVMAGGGSTRFGTDKARATLGGQSMLQRMANLVDEATGQVQVVAPAGRYEDCGLRTVRDRWPGEGPLGGILTALYTTSERDAGCDWNLIISCDMPFLSREWLGFMVARCAVSGAGVVLPRSAHGLEPLCACWQTSCMDAIQTIFDSGIRKVTEALKQFPTEVLDEADWKRFDSAGRLFGNMNTLADYQEARRIMDAETT